MSRLMSANLSRLLKDKIFWICVICMFVVSVYCMQMGSYVDKIDNRGRDLDYYYFHTAPYFGLFLSVYVSMFMGTEYNDGTIRNKITVGHNRKNIYLANLFTCFTGSVAIYLAWAIGGLSGIPYFGFWTVGINGYIELMIITLLSTLALTSIFVFMSHIITSKATSAVLSITVAMAILMTASFLYNLLCEPETISGITINADEGVVFGDEIANPAYVGAMARTVCTILLNILPSGQQIWVADELVTHPVMMCTSSLALIFVSVSLGQILFKKKDLK